MGRGRAKARSTANILDSIGEIVFTNFSLGVSAQSASTYMERVNDAGFSRSLKESF